MAEVVAMQGIERLFAVEFHGFRLYKSQNAGMLHCGIQTISRSIVLVRVCPLVTSSKYTRPENGGYIGVVSPQNKEYLLQPVPGGGESISVVSGISIDIAEDIQHIIYPLTDRDFVALKDCAGHRCECLLAVNVPISLNKVARLSESFDVF